MVICGYEWRAPRAEVPNSVLVSHVCWMRLDEHEDETKHHCACGALIVHGETWSSAQ